MEIKTNRILALLVILSLQLALVTNYAIVFDYFPNPSGDQTLAKLLFTEDPQNCTAEIPEKKAETLKTVEIEPQDQLDLCLPSVLVATSYQFSYLPLTSTPSRYAFSLKIYHHPGFLRPPRKLHAA